MTLSFLLNGESIEVRDAPPTTTLLDWLRENRGLKGSKEACREGDCGACTVMVRDANGARALNGCILFLPQLDGKEIVTVEGLSSPDGTLHPVQEALVACHGSQCGFCTPGFAVSMATAHLNGETDHEQHLAGNLCRCTGYAPILRAAQASEDAPIPDHLLAPRVRSSDVHASNPAEATALGASLRPKSSDELAELYGAKPEATLIAGATDVGLWVTKQMRDLGEVIFLNACSDLQQIETNGNTIKIGAGVTLAQLHPVVDRIWPSFGEMIRRYGSQQVREAATIGGNIANGSPIGDSPPPLIALGAKLHLRRTDARREIALEDFFIEYGQQDRAPGEFVEAVTIPDTTLPLAVYKLSKRFDQDISAVCGAFSIEVEEGRVRDARIAFGGMAGTPSRARAAETALIGKPWAESTVHSAMNEMDADFKPLSDMRGSAQYRMRTAQNMLLRHYLESQGTKTSVLEVSP